jgi:Leucine-rich repeat (LRR) protein
MKVCFIGVLLGQCPQLTQLVLAMRYTLGPEDPNPGRQLLDGWDLAVSRAGEGAAAAGSGSEAPVLQLPPIQHLEVRGPCAGLPDAWLSLPGAAAQLTALHLTLGSAPGLSSHQLQACSNLRELVIESSPSSPEELPDRDLPQHLVHLTALTKLVLKGCGLTALPAGLWCLTGLRHLDLTHSRIGRTLPSNISRLQQLRVLDLTQTWLRHLPRELGVWLPQLEELVITDSRIWRLPSGLTRLTRLEASACGIRYASYLQYLVQLKQLEMERCQLQPPLQQLSCLTTLETLKLGWVKGAGASYGVAPVSLQGAWPRLRSLTLIYAPLALLSGLPGVAGMGQLTQLFLCGLEPSSLEAIQQLGVLPELQSIYLATSSKEDVPMSWAPAAPWLQQQVRLTRLSMDGGMVEVSFLEQLPAQLEDLFLQWVQRCEVQEEQLSCLARLTRLRRLDLPKETLTRLPPWLSCLSHLEKLVCYGKSFDCSIQSGWEVLATLPLLRQVKVGMTSKLVEHAPHLCWTP